MPGTHAASFRDPSGFVFFDQEGTLLRQINRVYEADYRALMDSGLYRELVDARRLIAHRELSIDYSIGPDAAAVIQPERVRWISYPYEWCFSQLKDAALATLEIQRRAIAKGLSLKDASAYNIQFHRGLPTLVDTLSFERYEEGKPWVAYRQFCQHFLAPLALMSLVDVRLSALLRVHIDGIPLDLASKLLPWKTRVSPNLQMHLHLHAKSQRANAGKAKVAPKTGFPKQAMLGLVDSLESAVRHLGWSPEGTEWANYYEETNYSEASMVAKKLLVAGFLDEIKPETVWDLGANTGEFSRLSSDRGVPTVAWDVDPAAVERAYLGGKARQDAYLLPLIQDLTNPSPALGWDHRERESLAQRGPASTVLALALIHHLAIGNNVPLPRIAEFLAGLAEHVVIEFVPKEDSQVQRMLASREDIFDEYNTKGFEKAMTPLFEIVRRANVGESARTLYLLRRR